MNIIIIDHCFRDPQYYTENQLRERVLVPSLEARTHEVSTYRNIYHIMDKRSLQDVDGLLMHPLLPEVADTLATLRVGNPDARIAFFSYYCSVKRRNSFLVKDTIYSYSDVDGILAALNGDV